MYSYSVIKSFIITLITIRWTLCFSLTKYIESHPNIKVIKSKVGDSNNSSEWIQYDFYNNETKSQLIMDYNLPFQARRTQIITTNMNLSKDLRLAALEDNFDCKFKNGSVVGYSVTILNEIAHTTNLTPKFVFYNSTMDMFEALNERKVDLVLCHPHYKNSNFTIVYPTIKSQFLLIYKMENLNLVQDIFILMFVGSLWICFLLTLILMALCLKVSTKRYAQIDQSCKSWNWVEITLWAIATACQQGLNNTPKKFASSCIFLFGYGLSYLLYTAFAAGITSVLVQQNNRITTTDFIGENVKIVTLGHLENSLQDLKYVTVVGEMAELMDMLEGRKTVGIVPEMIVERYFAEFPNMDYQIFPLPFPHYKNGFIMLRTNQWRNFFYKWLSKFDEIGILDKIRRKELRIPDVLSASGYSSVGIHHVQSAFLIFYGGVLLSILFLLFEFLAIFYNETFKNSKVRVFGN